MVYAIKVREMDGLEPDPIFDNRSTILPPRRGWGPSGGGVSQPPDVRLALLRMYSISSALVDQLPSPSMLWNSCGGAVLD
jgi:hypothetical protein